MTTSRNRKAPTRQPAESAGILRWIFLRGTRVLTCEVRGSGKQAYEVSVVPHWDVSSSMIETFERPASALRRHAEIASYFREAGWSTIREGTPQRAKAFFASA
jgi:hypothetical protein